MRMDYLNSAKQQFEYYKQLGEKTINQLTEKELFWQFSDESNSIAIMIKHLWGNMMSRWTDFLSSDGEKEWRKRDEEFEMDTSSRAELMNLWEEGWECLFNALQFINEENFGTTIYIRNQGHSIPEAINRQMMHYAYHVGQMVYVGRMIKGADWQSLSIPKGVSKTYNAEKFSAEKSKKHFTDEYLKK
ncbi:MAG: DUF1572 domain-containing protein [Bacteroidia bacterium]|nr:DUF1572 domain-containing protein [Bacteroidia bacterium]NNJ55900.1 DUF1572 family protein [Bacteroidia bacterium]